MVRFTFKHDPVVSVTLGRWISGEISPMVQNPGREAGWGKFIVLV